MTKRKVAFWRTEAPKGEKPTTLTPDQKTQAKARAKAAGRPYPNLVDNAAVARSAKGRSNGRD
jgi:hypothetical protein